MSPRTPAPSAPLAVACALAVGVCLALPVNAAFAANKSWTEYSKEARNELRAGNYREAEALYSKSLEAAERADGAMGGTLRGETALRNLQHLVDLYRERKQTNDFIRVSELVLLAEKRIHGVAPADVQAELGKVYLMDGQPAAASRHLEGALATLETAPERDEDAILDTLSQIARLRVRQEDYEGAEDYYRRALDLAESMDPRSRTTALAMNDLAWFYVERDRNQEALPIARAAYDSLLRLQTTPIERVKVGDTLGVALLSLGRNKESLQIYRETLNEDGDIERQRRINVEMRDVYDNFILALEENGYDLEAERVGVRLDRAVDRRDRFDAIMTESTGKTRKGKGKRQGGSAEPPAASQND